MLLSDCRLLVSHMNGNNNTIPINEKDDLSTQCFCTISQCKMSIDMLNLNQHHKQVLLTMVSMSIVNLEHWREKDKLTYKSEIWLLLKH